MKAVVVIDANTILRIFDSGEGATRAHLLVKQIQKGSIVAHAPSFLLIEVLNVLMKKKKYSKEDAREFISTIEHIGIQFIDISCERIGDLLDCAYSYNITPYDAQYVLLTSDLSCVLITQDKELLAIKGIGITLDEYSISA